MKRVEIIHRDGNARTGRLTTANGDELLFPGACETEMLFFDLARDAHSNIPPLEDASFVGKYAWPDTIQPVMVHPHLVSRVGSIRSGDCVMTPNWHTLIENPRQLLRYLVPLQSTVPPDTAWYLPAAALPQNAAILVSAGYNLFDYAAVDLMAVKRQLCSPEGTYPADQAWKHGLCKCAGCLSEDAKVHNREALDNELALIRYRIAEGTFPELLEIRCRTAPSYVSMIRLLAGEPRTELSTPVVRTTPILATSTDTLRRVEIQRFMERVISRYSPPIAEVAVFLPCSAKKPYSLSQSHQKFTEAIRQRAHELIVTSPLGLVPREIEMMYPAAHYDVPVTGYWDHEERHIIQDVIYRYLVAHPYEQIISHLSGDAHIIVLEAANAAGFEVISTCTRHPTDPDDLKRLSEALSGERKVKRDTIRGMISYQFGYVPDVSGLVLKGRYKKQVITNIRRQIFSIDPLTGFLRPTFDGWKLLSTGYRVYIDDFVPSGDILAPGVIEADPAIRPGDEVLVVGDNANATGRAVMGADEMVRSKRGVAVRVRKVKKL